MEFRSLRECPNSTNVCENILKPDTMGVERWTPQQATSPSSLLKTEKLLYFEPSFVASASSSCTSSSLKKHWVLQFHNILHNHPSLLSIQSRIPHHTYHESQLQLSNTVLTKCLTICKKSNTTFISLPANFIDITLSTDVYPDSKLRILATQVNCRGYAPQPDNIRNLANTITQASFRGISEGWYLCITNQQGIRILAYGREGGDGLSKISGLGEKV